MADKTLEEMVEKTTDEIEKFLSDHISPKFVDIHNDIVLLYIYLDAPEKQSEIGMNMIIEALGRCRKILEYGDRIVLPLKPVYTGNIFGVN
jgi:hypothetical protein